MIVWIKGGIEHRSPIYYNSEQTKLEKTKLVKQENQVDDCITNIENIYNDKYNKFIYYYWVVKHITTPQVVTCVKRARFYKFHQIQVQNILKFIPITCSTTTNKNLVSENFEEFWKFIFEFFCAKAHAIEQYHNLIEVLWFWFDFNNNKGIPLVWPKCEPPIWRRLGPR